MSGLLGPGSTLGDLDAVLIELVEAGELRAGIAPDGRLRFEPVHAACRVGRSASDAAWSVVVGGSFRGP